MSKNEAVCREKTYHKMEKISVKPLRVMEKYGKISNVEGNLRNGGKSHGEDQIFDDGYRQKRHGALP